MMQNLSAFTELDENELLAVEGGWFFSCALAVALLMMFSTYAFPGVYAVQPVGVQPVTMV